MTSTKRINQFAIVYFPHGYVGLSINPQCRSHSSAASINRCNRILNQMRCCKSIAASIANDCRNELCRAATNKENARWRRQISPQLIALRALDCRAFQLINQAINKQFRNWKSIHRMNLAIILQRLLVWNEEMKRSSKAWRNSSRIWARPTIGNFWSSPINRRNPHSKHRPPTNISRGSKRSENDRNFSHSARRE